MECADPLRSDAQVMYTECALRPPLFAQEIVRARTISLGRLRSGRWMEGGGTRHYHHNRALQAPLSHAHTIYLSWKDFGLSLFHHTHVPFPTVSF